jgi:hypothetical protein
MALPLVSSFAAILTRSDSTEREASTADLDAHRVAYVLTRAETAECTCPGFCERDHCNE